MRVLVSMLLLLSCTIASISWAQTPTSKTDHLQPGNVYQLDTGDVVAIFSVDAKVGSRGCVLHAVQMDGALHLPFGKVEARGKTIAEIRDAIKPLSEAAQQNGMVDVVATIADLRNPNNDHILHNLH